jgi:hypothetical protein
MSAADAQKLTQEEQILHHYAAIIEKDLHFYQVSTSRDECAWRHKFQISLVFVFIAIRTS